MPKAPDNIRAPKRGVNNAHAPGEKLKQQSNSHNSTEFQLRDNGVYYITEDRKGNEEEHWICGYLEVVTRTRNPRNTDWGRVIRWRDHTHVLHTWTIPDELLQSDGVGVRQELARQGLAIAPSRRAHDALIAYIQTAKISRLARCVDRLGWYGDTYVLPGAIIGENGEQVFFQSPYAFEPAFSTKGDTRDWINHVSAQARGNSRVIFAICAALAAVLLEPVGETSGGFNFCGPSSMGKTTLLGVAGSVYGRPLEYCRLWRTTTNGLEGLAALHNDGILILDELLEVDPRDAGEAAYMLANGLGKQRAARDGSPRQPARWRLLFLSAGEQSLSAHMSRIGRKPTIGQEIRLAEIDADAGKGYGVFDVLPKGYETSNALAEGLAKAANTYYGKVGEVWIKTLVQKRHELPGVIAKYVQSFLDQHTTRQTTGQIRRVARRFALIAAAGEMATKAFLTGWETGAAMNGVGDCFKAWRESFDTGAANREEYKLLAQVKSFFEVNGASRFQDMDYSEDQRVIMNRAGFVHTLSDGQLEYWVFPEVFTAEVCKGFNTRSALKVLAEREWIKPDYKGGKSSQSRVLPGMGKQRIYVTGEGMWKEEE